MKVILACSVAVETSRKKPQRMAAGRGFVPVLGKHDKAVNCAVLAGVAMDSVTGTWHDMAA